MNLSDIRNHIDALDYQLTDLLQQRMDCSRQVAVAKQGSGIKVLNPAREQNVLQQVRKNAGLFQDEIAQVFTAIMGESRALQYKLLLCGEELQKIIANSTKSLPDNISPVVFSQNDDFLNNFSELDFIASMDMLFQKIRDKEIETGLIEMVQVKKLSTCSRLAYFRLHVSLAPKHSGGLIVTNKLIIPEKPEKLIFFLSCHHSKLPWLLNRLPASSQEAMELTAETSNGDMRLCLTVQGNPYNPDLLNAMAAVNEEASNFWLLGCI